MTTFVDHYQEHCMIVYYDLLGEYSLEKGAVVGSGDY